MRVEHESGFSRIFFLFYILEYSDVEAVPPRKLPPETICIGSLQILSNQDFLIFPGKQLTSTKKETPAG